MTMCPPPLHGFSHNWFTPLSPMIVTPCVLGKPLFTFFCHTQGEFLLYVHVYDDDTTDPDAVDDIFIEMSLATSSSFTAPQVFVGNFNNARLELSFRVQCSPGFAGEDCTGNY